MQCLFLASVFFQGSPPVLPVTPQSAFAPAIAPAPRSDGGWGASTSQNPITSVWPHPASPGCTSTLLARVSAPPYVPASPASNPPSPRSARKTSAPSYATSPSPAASYRTPESRSSSPISESPDTLLSVCLTELVDVTLTPAWVTRQKAVQKITQLLFDAEPQHRPTFDGFVSWLGQFLYLEHGPRCEPHSN